VLVQRTVKGSVFLSDFAEAVASASRQVEQQRRSNLNSAAAVHY
jgi:hypothetical protein